MWNEGDFDESIPEAIERDIDLWDIYHSLDVQAAVAADAERLLAALMEPQNTALRAAWAVVEKEMSR